MHELEIYQPRFILLSKNCVPHCDIYIRIAAVRASHTQEVLPTLLHNLLHAQRSVASNILEIKLHGILQLPTFHQNFYPWEQCHLRSPWMLGPRNVGSLAVGETLESKMGLNSQSISCSSPPTDSCHISFPFPFMGLVGCTAHMQLGKELCLWHWYWWQHQAAIGPTSSLHYQLISICHQYAGWSEPWWLGKHQWILRMSGPHPPDATWSEVAVWKTLW